MRGKYRVNVEYGGVFSKVMILLQYLERNRCNLEECYLCVSDPRALNECNYNPLDYVFNQELLKEFEYRVATCTCTYTAKKRIDESEAYDTLKKLANSLQYKEEFLNLVNRYVEEFSIDRDTVGIHVRLCDMNIHHKNDYGQLTYSDFLKVIKEEIAPESKLFVASDNLESLIKLKEEFGDRVKYVPDLIRAQLETDDSYELQLKYFKTKELWVEAFLEMMLLSKCSKFICRTSNLANMSIITSNTFKKVIML